MEEIVIYKSTENKIDIKVKFEKDTVWLNQQQISTLFNQSKQNISLHINNCFREGELIRESTVKESLTVQKEGQRNINRKVKYYNLDVIISVGNRVKSKQGTQFRIWANKILKDYWIFGHSHENISDFNIGKTKLITNQLGYVSYGENRKFDPGKYFEI